MITKQKKLVNVSKDAKTVEADTLIREYKQKKMGNKFRTYQQTRFSQCLVQH